MANAYSAPNFNIDTSTNVAGLTALKGSAPASTDNIYIYNGATLTVESALSFLNVMLGSKSTGAADAGGRYGIMTVNAGVTVTITGAASAVSSCILMSPTTPLTESKGCQLNINGTSASPVTFVNSVGANNASYRYTIQNVYGTITATYWNINYTYGTPFTFIANNTVSSNAGPTITDCTIGTLAAAAMNVFTSTAQTWNLPCDFRRMTWDCPAGGSSVIQNTSNALASGGSIDLSGWKNIGTLTSSYQTILLIGAGPSYAAQFKVGYSDIRPTRVIPTTLTLVDMQDGTVKVTVANITSVALTDLLVLYDASNNMRAAITRQEYGDATDRKPADCMLVAGIPLSSMANWYAKYTTDFSTYSDASSVASTITPALLPAAGNILTGYGAGQMSAENVGTYDEAARNSTDATAGDIASGKYVKVANVTTNGTFNESARNTNPGVSLVADGTTYKILGVDYEGTMVADGIAISNAVLVGTTLTLTVTGGGGSGRAWIVGTDYQQELTVSSWGASSIVLTLTRTLPAGAYRIVIVNAAGTSGTTAYTAATETEVVNAPSDPVHLRIIDAVVYQLKQIKTDSGYHYTIRKAFSPPRDLENENEFPCCNVDEGPEDCANQMSNYGDGNNAMLQNSFTVVIDAAVPVTQGTSQVTARARILADLQKLFGTQYYIRGSDGARTAFNCIYEGSEPWGQWESRPVTGVTARFKIWYRQRLTDPTVAI